MTAVKSFRLFFFLVFQVLEFPSTSAQILRCNFSPFSAPPSSLSSPSHPPLPNSFDLVTNGGISIILRFERAPFITQEHTLWLPWDRFFVMETIILRQEENEIPSCDLSNFARPNPVLSPSPLTSFASSCAEKGPIVPEIQVYPAFLTAFLHAFISFGRWRRISETGERDSPSVHHPDPSRGAVRLSWPPPYTLNTREPCEVPGTLQHIINSHPLSTPPPSSLPRLLSPTSSVSPAPPYFC